jgi:hypothetical protein
MTQPLTSSFLTALAELRRLEETAWQPTRAENIRILALLPWQWATNQNVALLIWMKQ